MDLARMRARARRYFSYLNLDLMVLPLNCITHRSVGFHEVLTITLAAPALLQSPACMRLCYL